MFSFARRSLSFDRLSFYKEPRHGIPVNVLTHVHVAPVEVYASLLYLSLIILKLPDYVTLAKHLCAMYSFPLILSILLLARMPLSQPYFGYAAIVIWHIGVRKTQRLRAGLRCSSRSGCMG